MERRDKGAARRRAPALWKGDAQDVSECDLHSQVSLRGPAIRRTRVLTMSMPCANAARSSSLIGRATISSTLLTQLSRTGRRRRDARWPTHRIQGPMLKRGPLQQGQMTSTSRARRRWQRDPRFSWARASSAGRWPSKVTGSQALWDASAPSMRTRMRTKTRTEKEKAKTTKMKTRVVSSRSTSDSRRLPASAATSTLTAFEHSRALRRRAAQRLAKMGEKTRQRPPRVTQTLQLRPCHLRPLHHHWHQRRLRSSK